LELSEYLFSWEFTTYCITGTTKQQQQPQKKESITQKKLIVIKTFSHENEKPPFANKK